MIARDGAYSGLVISVDGGDCAASSAAVQQIGIFRHQGAVFEILGDQVVPHLGGQAEAMKVMQGLESLGSKAFIFRIGSVGITSPSSGYFNNLNAVVQRALVYLDTSTAFSCL
jgi:hypothetical protein